MWNSICGLLRVMVNNVRFMIINMGGCFACKGKCTSRLDNEWSVSRNAEVELGYHFSSLRGCRFLVRNTGQLRIGDNVGMNTNCTVACHEKIEIGDGTEIGPNVCIYDHDHDYKCAGGIKAGQYKTSPVTIGKNVWIGANVIILRGTTIGDDCIIAAGSVVRGQIPSRSLFYSKLQSDCKPIEVKELECVDHH